MELRQGVGPNTNSSHHTLMPFLGHSIAGSILNFIGGSLRWMYGSVWRTIFNQPKFTFKEYLYRPNN